MKLSWLALAALLLLGGCATAPPAHRDNLCDLFAERPAWYEASVKAAERWGGPIQTPLAIIHHESGFRADARPRMRYFLWLIPIGRGSSAYGYPQAQDPAWEDYQREAGSWFSDRDDFADAVDFVQWYMYKTAKINAVPQTDAYAQYLNYHEGWRGYRSGAYRRNARLRANARGVAARAQRYGAQYRACRQRLDAGL